MPFTDRQRELGHLVAEALGEYFSKHDVSGYSIGYSGGLDSTVLAYLGRKKLKAYTVGSSSARDVKNTEAGLRLMGIGAVRIPIEDLDLEKYISVLAEIDPRISKRDIGYEMVLAILLDHIEEERLVTGQGADELFYGYHRFAEDRELSNEWHLNKLIRETLPREKAIAEYFGKKLITPYLDSSIGQILETVERDEHFSGSVNKAILRHAALELGVPGALADVKKTAAQYGSGIMKKLKTSSSWNKLPESTQE